MRRGTVIFIISCRRLEERTCRMLLIANNSRVDSRRSHGIYFLSTHVALPSIVSICIPLARHFPALSVSVSKSFFMHLMALSTIATIEDRGMNMNVGNRQPGTRSDCFPKDARSDVTVSNFTRSDGRMYVSFYLLVSGPTNGFVNNWIKAFDANIIPTSTFSWMSSLCLAMYLYSESGSSVCTKLYIVNFLSTQF